MTPAQQLIEENADKLVDELASFGAASDECDADTITAAEYARLIKEINERFEERRNDAEEYEARTSGRVRFNPREEAETLVEEAYTEE